MGSRMKAAGLILVVLACGVFLFWRFRPLGPIERTLSRLPPGLAIEAYVAPAVLERAPGAFGAADLDLADAADALALGLGRGQLYAVASGAFDAVDTRSKLESAGIECPSSFPAAACVGMRGRDWLSVSLLDEDLLGVSYGANKQGVGELAKARAGSQDELERVRGEIRSRALLWAAIRSRRLDEIMASPPEGWINLSLLARALRNAPVAYLTVRPSPLANSLSLELEAPCPSEAEAAELRGIVEELNRFALKLTEKQQAEDWRPMLESLELEQEGTVVSAKWSLREQDLKKLQL